jgi:molybdopterin synthase catalytic subunit
MIDSSFVKITNTVLSPDEVVAQAGTSGSGCVVTYVGLIRDNSRGRTVKSVEYTDPDGEAEERLGEIARDIARKFPVNKVVIYHRTGVLQVGDINLVVAIAAGHRGEGFAACQYAIDQFKEKLPTGKVETYIDGTTWMGE